MFQTQLEVFADYHQFYVKDDDGGIDYGENWTREATEKMILVGRRLIAFGTARDMNVPVLLEVHDIEPGGDTESWEHVAEGSLEITTGRLVIAGCTDYEPDAMRIPVAHGYYRARLSSRGLKDLSSDGLDGNDTYRRIAEIGYSIAGAQWSQGLATEAARKVIGIAFECCPAMVKVRAMSDARNVCVVACARKDYHAEKGCSAIEPLFRQRARR